jgi:hypothetical protein
MLRCTHVVPHMITRVCLYILYLITFLPTCTACTCVLYSMYMCIVLYVYIMCIVLPHVQEAFTCVLKGHIDLCALIFPNKTHGHRIEAIARAPLWTAGLDYRHGTGHGVGSFLCVHEGPQSVGSRPSPEPLQASMFISDGQSPPLSSSSPLSVE